MEEKLFKAFWIITLFIIPLGLITNTFKYVGITTATMALCIISFKTIKEILK